MTEPAPARERRPRRTPKAIQREDTSGGSLYAAHAKVYPREVKGRFASMRWLAVVVLLGIYYVVPWVHFDGRQLVLFDLPARKFYVFALTLYPQDFLYLTGLLIIAALSLFFFTAIAGRLWCGYACPQTVWTEAFVWMERRIEGDRNRQMKLDRAPWTTHKLAIKATKHGVWLLFSLWTGYTFVGYFTDMHTLGAEIVSFSTGPWETFWILFYALATYGNAGWLREQVCTYMCPYARFQSAMFDRDTLVIGYDPARGEPRGPRKRGTDPRAAGIGDCVDCTLCVQVCPTGIDIREGLQYQCIACAACIDVCDTVMDRVGYPKGLIRYTTENAVAGQRSRVLRPRTLVYAAGLLAITLGIVYSMATRMPLEFDVLRDRNALFRDVAGGMVENVYTLKIVNMDQRAHRYRLTFEGIEGAHLLLDDAGLLEVPAGAVQAVPLRVRVDPDRLSSRSTEVEFRIEAVDVPAIHADEDSRFLGPGR